jgi:hypothetical protein
VDALREVRRLEPRLGEGTAAAAENPGGSFAHGRAAAADA